MTDFHDGGFFAFALEIFGAGLVIGVVLGLIAGAVIR